MPNAGAGKPSRLRPAALHDLDTIWIYAARTWSPPLADIYIRKLFAALERIAGAPEIARERVEYAPPRPIPSSPSSSSASRRATAST